MLVVLFAPTGAKPIVLVMGICGVGIIVTGWLADSVLSKDDGTPAMRAVSDPIKVGGYLYRSGLLGYIFWVDATKTWTSFFFSAYRLLGSMK